MQPIMPHSFLFGHVPLVMKELSTAKSYSKLYLPHRLAMRFPDLVSKHGLLYLDHWPFGHPMILMVNPNMQAQIAQSPSLPKSPIIERELKPLAHMQDLVTLEGAEWKRWRAVYNPGFSARNITALLPSFLDEITVMRNRFREIAETGEIVKMENVIALATIDVVCRAAL